MLTPSHATLSLLYGMANSIRTLLHAPSCCVESDFVQAVCSSERLCTPRDIKRNLPHSSSKNQQVHQHFDRMPQPQSDALRGSIELLVLKTLSLESMHGWGIGQRIQQISGGKFDVNQGSLYPALQRLEQQGLITSDWKTTENNRRARYYEIMPAGRRALGREMESWRRFAATMEMILRTT
jgi:PadR family transcriptional regulator PadR